MDTESPLFRCRCSHNSLGIVTLRDFPNRTTLIVNFTGIVSYIKFNRLQAKPAKIITNGGGKDESSPRSGGRFLF